MTSVNRLLDLRIGLFNYNYLENKGERVNETIQTSCTYEYKILGNIFCLATRLPRVLEIYQFLTRLCTRDICCDLTWIGCDSNGLI